MEHYKFFCNKNCEYFPCHETSSPEEFNCLFCFCPLYVLGDKCGGNFTYTQDGVKDCSSCLLPHKAANYNYIINQYNKIAEIMSKN